MTAATLDLKAAPVVIDPRKDIVGFPAVNASGGAPATAAVLTAAFQRRGAPVVLVNATGGETGPARGVGDRRDRL